jgi:hypothetical protein
MKRHRYICAAGILAIALTGIGVAGASPRAVTSPDYRGSVAGPVSDPEQEGTIKIEVRDRKLRPLAVDLTDFVLQCDDGTTSMRSAALQGDIRPNGRFLLQSRYYAQGISQIYAEVSGSLRDHRASGEFYMLANSLGSVTHNLDCSTPYPQKWKAHRVSRPDKFSG